MALPRTYLFVPGDRPERFAKALATAADAVIVDLEDAVLPAAKPSARDAVAAFLAACPTGGTDRGRLVVRVNDESTPWFADDLALLASARVQTRDAAQGRARGDGRAAARGLPVASRCWRWWNRRVACRPPRTWPPRPACSGWCSAPSTSRSTWTWATRPSRSTRWPAGWPWRRAQPGIASPVAGVTTALDDESLLLADLARARAFGFGAKLCIHPKQVEPIHAALRPTDAERHWAQRVLDAAAASPGAVQLDGRMVDRPVIERARRLLERADR
jgi:citrate lyase subunit beta/citryl-CoA lyase